MENFPCERLHHCPYKDSYNGCLSKICSDRCGQSGKMHNTIAYACVPCTVERSDGENKHRTYWSMASAITNTLHWNPEKGEKYSYTIKDMNNEILYSGSFVGKIRVYQYYDFADGPFFCFEPVERR